MTVPRVLLYSNRANELDFYAELIEKESLPIELLICRSEADIFNAIEEADIIFGVHLPPESYLQAKKLRWIQSMWAGVERLMQVNLPDGVIITKPWGVFGKFLSHYVFGNLLALKIHVHEALAAQGQSQWSPYRIETLNGLVMGIAGTGDIATEITATARAFGMTCWGLNSNGRASSGFERTFSRDQLNDFVSGIDVLVITLPATPETEGMFNYEVLSRLRTSAVIVNIGRGTVIDDNALLNLLQQKKIAAAILDVFREEPLPKDHPYWTAPNCIVTPHIGGPSLPEDITACFLTNLRAYLAGNALKGIVNRKRGY